MGGSDVTGSWITPETGLRLSAREGSTNTALQPVVKLSFKMKRKGKVMGSSMSLGFIHWGPSMSVQNFSAIYTMVDEIFQSGSKSGSKAKLEAWLKTKTKIHKSSQVVGGLLD